LKIDGTNVLTILILLLSFFMLIFFVIKPIIGMSYSHYEGYIAFTEKQENGYVALVVKNLPEKELSEYKNTELDQFAQKPSEDYGTNGGYFSMKKKDFNKIKKGQKVIITFKEQAVPDIWGYPIKAASVKIIGK
jgi:hypothetical protein